MSKPRQVTIQVTGQLPLEAVSPLFSNFVGIARVGTEVQFEFIYVDLNQLATILQGVEKSGSVGPIPTYSGKTVVKVVMPAQSFVQLEAHLGKIFSDIKTELKKQEHGEELNARRRVTS